MKFEIELLRSGTWSAKHLDSSTKATGFRMGHPVFDSRDAADAHLDKLVTIGGFERSRLRVAEIEVDHASPLLVGTRNAVEARNMKLIATSMNRYNGGVAAKRKYGSATMTEFIVMRPEDQSHPERWATVTTGGKTPGARATEAKRIGEPIVRENLRKLGIEA
jgi:hypothetical protein